MDEADKKQEVCGVLIDGRRCSQPLQYVPEGTGITSGWYHVDHTGAAGTNHFAVPMSWLR